MDQSGVMGIQSHFIDNVFHKRKYTNIKAHECIITSIPKRRSPNFRAEDLGNLAIKLGNIQKCHLKYDQIRKILAHKKNVVAERGGWGRETEHQAGAPRVSQHTQHEPGEAGPSLCTQLLLWSCSK